MFRPSLLSAYAISPTGYTADAPVLALVEDTLACHSLSVTTSKDWKLFGDLTVNATVHGSIGYARITSQLVEPTGGMCANYGGTVALRYVQSWGSLTFGYHYDELVSIVASSDLALSQSLSYSGVYANHRVRTMERGTRWNIHGMDQSLKTLAPFARLTLSF